MMSKKIIILQHIDIETPGYILDLMKKDNLNLTTIQLDEGEKIPNNIEEFDGIEWKKTNDSNMRFFGTIADKPTCHTADRPGVSLHVLARYAGEGYTQVAAPTKEGAILPVGRHNRMFRSF